MTKNFKWILAAFAILPAPCASLAAGGQEADQPVVVASDESLGEKVADTDFMILDEAVRPVQDVMQPPDPQTPASTVSTGNAPTIGSLAALGLREQPAQPPAGETANPGSELNVAAAGAVASNVVPVSAANVIAAPEMASILRDAASTPTVSVQRRNPVSFDPHVRGYHFDQILTRSNGIWAPVRQDLDSMISKLDPALIEDIVVIPGPYALRFGPAFSYIGVETIGAPRSDCPGLQSNARAGLTWRDNGDRLFGRASASVAGQDRGFIGHYGSRTGSDYTSGNGTQIPSSYDNQTFLGQFGFDLTSHSRLEVRYDRLDQNDTEYALQFFDVNYLGADSGSFRYIDIDPGGLCTEIVVEGFYNRTRYNGDNQNASKAPVRQRVIEALNDGLGATVAEQFVGDTFGHRMLTGGRQAFTLGETDWLHARVGADIRYEDQQITENFFFRDSDPQSELFPIQTQLPTAWFSNVGLFSEVVLPVFASMDSTLGARVDFYDSDARISELNPANNSLKGPYAQNETLYSFYWLNDLQVTDAWSSQFGFGHGQRAPSLFNRYSNQVFLGIIQSGFSKIVGSPNLDPERLWQMDFALKADYENFRGRAAIYQSWVLDYVTYGGNLITSPEGARQLFAINTEMATLAGCEFYGEYDLSNSWTVFSALQYVQGTDQEIDAPLWGIAPLDARLGVRLHDEDGGGRWGVEMAVRMVDRQNRAGVIRNIADPTVLIPIEEQTPSFTTVDLRSYFNYSENTSIVAGFENLFDENYLEHLDLRLPAYGTSPAAFAYAPGFTFYTGVEFAR